MSPVPAASPDANRSESSVSINIPESTVKFRKENERANEMIPDLFKQLEKLELSDHHTNTIQDAESAVRQTKQQRQDISSSIRSAFTYKKFKYVPPAQSIFIPTARPFRLLPEEDEPVYDEEEDEQTDVLEPELEVINEFISDKFMRSSRGEVLIEKFDIPITRKDLETLEGLNWLNDEVINFYLQMIMSRSQSLDNLPAVYVFNTFFYTKLTSAENSYNMLRRWTRKVDIFSHDFILIPLHLGMHWTLCSVNCKSKSISYYDSMAGGQVNQKGDGHMKAILSYLQKEHADKKKTPLPNDWRINPVGESQDVNQNDRIPQQENGSDCGVFTCRFAEYISRRASFRFRQVRLSSRTSNPLSFKLFFCSIR
jgi:sentrin-specific protease 1